MILAPRVLASLKLCKRLLFRRKNAESRLQWPIFLLKNQKNKFISTKKLSVLFFSVNFFFIQICQKCLFRTLKVKLVTKITHKDNTRTKLEIFGQRGKYSDSVGNIRTTFRPPIVRIFPIPLYNYIFQGVASNA